MKIVYIREAKTKGYLRIGALDGGKEMHFTVSVSNYDSLGGFSRGDEVSDETVDKLLEYDMRYRARAKAFSLLSYTDNSESQLMSKLLRYGIKRVVAEECVSDMVRLGYVNSKRQIERLILNENRLHSYGPLRITDKLLSKGYRRSEIKEVMDRLLESGEIDFEASRKKLLSGLSEENDGERVRKILYKNGYTL